MKSKNTTLIVIGVIVALVVIGNPFYVVNEAQQAVVTQFGEPIGNPITKAGLHFKIPFIQKITYFEKRMLEWDGYPSEIPTQDKKYIWVDTTARWKIINALKFFKSVSNERGAQAILDGVIDAAVRDNVTAQNLIELVRSSDRLNKLSDKITKDIEFIDEGALETIKIGRDRIRQRILKDASMDMAARYGIELIDVRIKRVNYVDEVKIKVYERMIAERRRAAEKYRSEGRGVSAEIEGRTDKELKGILSEAYRQSQIVKGEADATSTKIYAIAYNKAPEFFAFLKTMESYDDTIGNDTTVILTTEGEYFKYLDKISP